MRLHRVLNIPIKRMRESGNLLHCRYSGSLGALLIELLFLYLELGLLAGCCILYVDNGSWHDCTDSL